MKKLCVSICILFSFMLCGCSDIATQIDTDTIKQQVETIASQIDVETIITEVIESIDWDELKTYAQQGYDSLTEHFPALKAENVKSFLKENGLELLNNYIESSDDTMQENARKLGEIIKILNPELTDEVDSVIGK